MAVGRWWWWSCVVVVELGVSWLWVCGCGGIGCIMWQWADGSCVELVVVMVARRGEGVEGVDREPLHLAFQAREGMEMVVC